MTFVITRGCCKDASCVPVCPVNCIRPTPEDPDFATAEQLYVDPAACIDCGACMDECPVDAVHSEWDLAEDMGDFVGINASYFTAGVAAAPAPARSPAPRRLPTGHAALSVAVIGSGPAGCYAAAELSEIR
ncbi:MAG TPA: 4Fe-4S binding protein, partial [Trebonia sp.]|nr:4Fe-4S binding protein [Trebonia sp.]